MAFLFMSYIKKWDTRVLTKIYRPLRGESRFTISDIRKILEITKLSFEECFKVREGATEVSGRRLQS